MSYSPVYHCLPCAMDQGFQRSMWCVGVRDSENKKPNQTRPHQTPTWTSTMKPSRDLGGFFSAGPIGGFFVFRPDRSRASKWLLHITEAQQNVEQTSTNQRDAGVVAVVAPKPS